MTINHHLNEQLLIGYAAGILPEAFDLVVATHVSMCDQCRADLASFEAVGGDQLIETLSVELSDESLTATFDKIAAMKPVEKPIHDPDEVFPSPLAQYVGGGKNAVNWKPLGMGVKQSILKTTTDATARLLYIPAGCAVPEHGHHGTELTLVLQGAFSDHLDRFDRGDIEIANEDLDHTPVAEVGADCICLAATDAKLRFNAFLPKLLQPFFRI